MRKIKKANRRACSIEVSPLTTAIKYELLLPTEMGNHADTHCFRKNFIVLDCTHQKCSVATFLVEHDKTQEIDIVTSATAVDLKDGSTIVYVFGRGLCFRGVVDLILPQVALTRNCIVNPIESLPRGSRV